MTLSDFVDKTIKGIKAGTTASGESAMNIDVKFDLHFTTNTDDEAIHVFDGSQADGDNASKIAFTVKL